MKFNHDRPLSDFQDDIDKLKANGYNPIAVSQMCFYDVFVFETNEEAQRAYRQFERDKDDMWIGDIGGWWYGMNDFVQAVKDYESKSESKVLIYWLTI